MRYGIQQYFILTRTSSHLKTKEDPGVRCETVSFVMSEATPIKSPQHPWKSMS